MSDVHTINTMTGQVTTPPTSVSVPTVAIPRADMTMSIPRADITQVQAPAQPWHQSLDNDIKTYSLKKGYDLGDPVKAFTFAAKGHMEAEKFLGVPPNQLLRLPADVNDEAGWNAVYQRFGKPMDKSGYDLSKVKFSDGSDLDTDFAAFMKEKAFELHLPTTSAAAVTQAFIGYMEQSDQREAEQMTQRLAEEKSQLNKDWGNQFEYNRQLAVQGANKLKMTAEDVNALEKVVGYSRIMEMLRKVGSGTAEDVFVPGKQGGDFMNSEQTAQARLSELQASADWRDRFIKGDPQARMEHEQLTKIIAKYVEEAA